MNKGIAQLYVKKRKFADQSPLNLGIDSSKNAVTSIKDSIFVLYSTM